jgi:putative DNA primase/helicase
VAPNRQVRPQVEDLEAHETTGGYVKASVSAGTHSSAFDRLLVALESHGSTVRTNGTTATAQCPAHDDHNPSLSLRRIEGTVLICCQAGCQSVDVLAALNTGLRDLYDEPSGARYDYTDAAGVKTRTVHRSPAKRWRQSGQTTGTPQLYRLPRVLEAVKAGDTIYLVEGEKDVHAVESLGAVATTSPMGATNWGKVDPSPLYGAHVIVVPDRDQAGDRYLRAVVETLSGKATSIKVMHAKVGKDAADHIAAGHSLDELIEADLLDVVGDPAITVITLADVEPKPVSWLWEGHLPAGKLVVLDGDPSVGKSTLAIDWAARLSVGAPWPDGTGCLLDDVLVLSAEDGLADTIRPRLDAAGGDPARVHALTDVTYRDDEGNLRRRSITLADVEEIKAAVEKYIARLVIIDLPTGEGRLAQRSGHPHRAGTARRSCREDGLLHPAAASHEQDRRPQPVVPRRRFDRDSRRRPSRVRGRHRPRRRNPASARQHETEPCTRARVNGLSAGRC